MKALTSKACTEFEIRQAKVFQKVVTFRRSVYWEAEEQNGRDMHLESVSVSLLTLRTSDIIFLFSKTTVVSYISDCQSTSRGRVPVGHVTRLSEERHKILISVSAVEFGAVRKQGARYCGAVRTQGARYCGAVRTQGHVTVEQYVHRGHVTVEQYVHREHVTVEQYVHRGHVTVEKYYVIRNCRPALSGK